VIYKPENFLSSLGQPDAGFNIVCAECAFWDVNGVGTCHRQAPNGGEAAPWPVTSAQAWCGLWLESFSAFTRRTEGLGKVYAGVSGIAGVTKENTK
jgi:hypothetical protein